MRRTSMAIASVILFATIAAAQNNNRYLQAIFNAPVEGPDYQYTLAFATEKKSATLRIDPSMQPGSRVQVMSKATEKQLAALEKRIANAEEKPMSGFWCSDFAKSIPPDAKFVSETSETATYTFLPIPDAAKDNDAKFMTHMRGYVTVDKSEPAILAYRLEELAPFKPAWIARINDFDLQAECARSPDGRTYLSTFKMTIDGKVALKKFLDWETRQISDLVVVNDAH